MTMTKVLVGNVKDIDIKGSRKLQMAGTEIAIFRLTSGEVLAIENKCPHKGGALSEGMVCGSKVHCPLHDSRIDLHSGNVLAPDTGHVKTYEVEVDPASGQIYLTI
ncbi:nitrite reductase (NADH) small subunit [Paenibacillus sp. PastF-1]|nr:nitrite reductase (NADH) small subunit [Paenibacillus sp. PastF-2]MDF9845816.1 nitrite reductase (NADH) small subunit [Paenibacillus sp. PastM-2]MDF9852389.1 nitrite reductase (NADH) small subunit [Paenibacillus sp. PastF-1]MDH6477881.1 nitrite reductase (NADH) small subunit [Paenibacillus sp. PastH-2]MDH6505620.1 nitrite reductase (NADH) small subunit [Paenibacillus sp. PastM-3]